MSIVQVKFSSASYLGDFLEGVRSLLANADYYEKSDDRYTACQFLLDAGIEDVDFDLLQISIPASTPIENLFVLFNGICQVHSRFPETMLDINGWSEICSLSYEQDGLGKFVDYATAMRDPRFSHLPRCFVAY